MDITISYPGGVITARLHEDGTLSNYPERRMARLALDGTRVSIRSASGKTQDCVIFREEHGDTFAMLWSAETDWWTE